MSVPPQEWVCLEPGGTHIPYVDRVADEEPYLAAPKSVVGHGLVAGTPWSITAYAVSAERPWPTFDGENSPRRWFDFFLGGTPGLPGGWPGGYGGVTVSAEIRFQDHFRLQHVGTLEGPLKIAVVLLTVPKPMRVEFGMDGSRQQRVRLLGSPRDFPEVAILAAAEPHPRLVVTALDAGGGLLDQAVIDAR